MQQLCKDSFIQSIFFGYQGASREAVQCCYGLWAPEHRQAALQLLAHMLCLPGHIYAHF
jgi:hypothetical protein